MEEFLKIVDTIDGFVWGYFLMFLLVGTGIFLTIRFRFVQFRHFRHGWSLITGKWDDPKDDGEITHLQALSTALSATIGTGNIAGVATAIASGGPGAVFWMWVTALVGMCTKFTCCLLSQKYREIDERGIVAGGPMYYLRDGLNLGWLGWLFAFFAAIASFGIGNMVQSNSVAQPLHDYLGIPKLGLGIVLAILVALVIIGGVRRIARVAEKIVPLMAILYFLAALIIILLNYKLVPAAFMSIFYGVFGLKPAAGGALGYGVSQAMRFGIARGLFSNEAGLGSAAIAHAPARTKEPVREGFVAMLGPFIDTIVICTMTAIVIIISGLYQTSENLTGATLSARAFDHSLFGHGHHVVNFGLIFFAFTTIIGWSYYGDRSVKFLFGKRGDQAVTIYRWIYVILIPVGAAIPLKLVWGLSDIANGLMAFPNLIALIGLSGVVAKLLKDYEIRLPTMQPLGEQQIWFLRLWSKKK
ncbi:alanine/glycine:cation symporter family protein [candidate division CSSED10-310 bacterium]|uniref:Alanine/glycine:cation symporter family protein n=1 Tax=candidate division CSSED10-310 bacterium TaxID=2855610 RepID=A0ABV6YWJ6_UNCC1